MGKKDKLKDKIKAAKKTQSKKTLLMREAASQGALCELISAVRGTDKSEIDNHEEDETVGSYSALMLACMNGHPACVTYLLAHHAVLEQTDMHSLTCLMWACINGHRDVIKLLMKHRVDLNARDNKEHTALHWAAMKGSHRCIPLLLHTKLSHYSSAKTRVDINAVTRDGCTSLALAIQHQEWTCVDKLLTEGADANIIPKAHRHLPDASLFDSCRDDDDRTFFQLVLNNHEIRRILKQTFHDTSTTTSNGVNNENDEILDLICEYVQEEKKRKKKKIKKQQQDEKEIEENRDGDADEDRLDKITNHITATVS